MRDLSNRMRYVWSVLTIPPSYRLIGGLLLAGLIIPIVIGFAVSIATPMISPGDADRRLNNPAEKVVLIDARDRDAYDAFSLRRAWNLPLSLMTERTRTEPVLNGADSILVICDTGYDASMAVHKLRRLGYRNVWGIAGGMDAWLASNTAIDKTIRTKYGERPGVTGVSWSLLDQAAIVIAAFFVKPIYQIISFIIIVLLWKSQASDLLAVKWAMLAFLIGENACAANYLFFQDQSLLMEFIHMYGMLVCFGLMTYAMMEAVDKRIVHFSDRGRSCALAQLCGRCYKYQDAGCTLRSFFLLLIPAVAVIAAMPLSGSLAHRRYEGLVFGSRSLFGHPVAYQYLESRVFPVLSLFFLGAAFITLMRRKEEGFGASKAWFAMGIGLLGFSLMRFFLYWGYQDRPLWADVWEELTEFLFIVAVLWIAWRVRTASRTEAPILASS